MRFPDIGSMKVGTHNVSAVYLGSNKVWPVITARNYEVVEGTVQVHYSSGTEIFASGLNYAYLEGTVNVWDENWEELIDTLYNQRLTPVFAGEEGNFYISGNTIRAYSLGAAPADMSSVYVSGCYGDSSYVEANDQVYQEANAIVSTSYGRWGAWRTDRQERINEGDYTAYITSDYYTSASSPAPWGGVTNILALNYGAYHHEYYLYYKSRERTATYTWTSGSTSTGTDTENTTETGTPFERSDSVMVSVNPVGWLTRNGNMITISRNNGEARSAVITVQNMQSITATASVTIYQARCPIPQLVPNFNNITISSTGLSMIASFNETYADSLAYRVEMRLAGYQTHNIDGTVGSSGALVQLSPTWSDLGLIPAHGAQYTLSVTTRVKLPEDTGWEYAKTWSGSTTITYP